MILTPTKASYLLMSMLKVLYPCCNFPLIYLKVAGFLTILQIICVLLYIHPYIFDVLTGQEVDLSLRISQPVIQSPKRDHESVGIQFQYGSLETSETKKSKASSPATLRSKNHTFVSFGPKLFNLTRQGLID